MQGGRSWCRYGCHFPDNYSRKG